MASSHLFTRATPVVSITSAPLSPDQEYDARRRRYAAMMSLRIACVVAAVLVSGVSLLLSLALMVAGAVLPWCAVLIANDNLPKQRRPVPAGTRPAIAGPSGRVLEG